MLTASYLTVVHLIPNLLRMIFANSLLLKVANHLVFSCVGPGHNLHLVRIFIHTYIYTFAKTLL